MNQRCVKVFSASQLWWCRIHFALVSPHAVEDKAAGVGVGFDVFCPIKGTRYLRRNSWKDIKTTEKMGIA